MHFISMECELLQDLWFILAESKNKITFEPEFKLHVKINNLFFPGMTRGNAITYCTQYLDQKIGRLQMDWKELAQGMQNDSKSTAGDKHETGQAMAQMEQEKLARQIKELQDQKQSLQAIEDKYSNRKIINGSLVKTDKGWFFVCIPLGKIQADSETFIGLSPKSPLGQQLLGLTPGQSVQVNNSTYQILEIL